MKNKSKILKIVGLCMVLLLIVGWAKGAIQVKTVTLSLSSGNVIYGNSSSVIYNMTIITNGNGSSTFNLTFSGLPTYATVTPTYLTITGNTTISLNITNNNGTKYCAAGLYKFNVTIDTKTSNSIDYSIGKRALSVTGMFTTQDKIYDGNTLAPVNVTNLSWIGLVSGDDVSLAYNFADKNVGTGKPITCTITGASIGNYSFTPPSLTSRDITPKTLLINGATSANKVYDGNVSAPVTCSFDGKILTDNIILTGAFADKNVGIAKPISLSITGTDVNNYTFTLPSVTARDISPKSLTLSGATVTSKVFDGTTIATITGGSLVGVISPDVVDLTQAGTFASANVGTGISVTSNCLISGTDAGNYTLTQPTGLTGNITAPTAVSWNGGTSTDWVTTSNWTPPYLPDATIDVTIASATNKPVIAADIQAACNNLTINTGAGLTINPLGQLTISGNLTNNAGSTGLTLLSGETSGTGSLIVNGSVSGTATLTRAMTSGAWHLVASPLEGQTIQDFLGANSTIPTTMTASNLRAMREYLPLTNEWGEFFTTGATGTTGDLLIGKGYCMRVKSSTAHEVVFTGTLQAGDKTISGLSAGNWNCIGNPYTSAIGVTGSATSAANFLTVNAVTNVNIDPAYGIYVWNKTDAANGTAGQYTAISNASNLENLHYLQQGQGFMVKMASGKTSVSFTKAMQAHNTSLTLKSTEDIWPTIKLKAAGDSTASSTIIAFHEGMTNGLDPTYDAGLLKSGGSMELYTRLVDDYGIPFAIQALPSNQYDRLIVPIGVDYLKGGSVSFSAENFYLPSSCRPILEDRLTGIFTDLSDKSYTTALTANTAGTGRFFLHTSYATTGTDNHDNGQGLSAWVIGNQEININGKVSNGAVASLYDIQGRLIVTHAMREGIRHRISLPSLKPGIYFLQVRDQQKIQTLKVNIGQ